MKEFFIALILFLVIDGPYLGFIAAKFFNRVINNIQGSPIKLKPFGAFITYILMGLAIKYFVLNNAKSEKDVLLNGFLIGLIIYGIYDFTNYAIFTNWTLEATIRDLIWGIFLFTIVSYSTYKISKLLQ